MIPTSNYITTAIKTGNSYALRVPKKYIEDVQLELGQKAIIQLPIPEPKQHREHIQELLRQLQDAATWQREIRKDRPLPGRE